MSHENLIVGTRLALALRRAVVLVLLGVWSFPATSLAAPRPSASPVVRLPTTDSPSALGAPVAAESDALAAREKKSPALQDFKGGGVSIYIGSGVLLVVVIILLILLI